MVNIKNSTNEECCRLDTEKSKMFLNSFTSEMVKTIRQRTSSPEIYECFDLFENLVAILQFTDDKFMIMVPGEIVEIPILVKVSKGYNGFYDDDELVELLRDAFSTIDTYFQHRKYVHEVNLKYGAVEYHVALTTSDGTENIQKALSDLRLYQKSNFTPQEVLKLRCGGPTMNFHQSIYKVLLEHRIERGYKFPEATDKIGLNDGHIESELEFFKTTVDGLGGKVKTICWLFDKTFEDFERIFRANAHRGMEIFE